MMATPTLQLQDVHEGVAPAWWPLAPGWWLVLAAIVVVVALLVWRAARGRRRQVALLRLFDAAVDRAGNPSQQVAVMSELLRRAARRKDAGADMLEGEDWLRFLDDGLPQAMFGTGAGRLLLDGGFRNDVAAEQADALRAVARQRYLGWMRGA